ncbi:MAG: VWA domain-containing protein [Acidobacteriota bacterium]
MSFGSARKASIALVIVVSLFLIASGAVRQAGRGSSGRRVVTLNVIAHTPDDRQITKEDFELYDSGTVQEIESFSRVDSGSRIVLMVDGSTSLRAEAEALKKTVEAVIGELYADDEMMVVGFNESAEIIEDMTPDLKALESASAKLTKKGFPNLFDALIAVTDSLSHQAKRGIEKLAIVLVSDGYDSESKTKFDAALRALQDENIVLYAIQTPDRTRGALLRDKPKPPIVLERITEGTGGTVFPFDKASEAAKAIADDLRKHWYRLVYFPSGINTINTRRLLLMSHDKKIELRTKGSHPSKYPSN